MMMITTHVGDNYCHIDDYEVDNLNRNLNTVLRIQKNEEEDEI